MSLAINPQQPSNDIRIRRGRVDSVDLFEVKEHELVILERGRQADIFLNFAVFLISLAVTCFLTLVSATFKKTIYETAAVVIMIIGFLGGGFLIILWKRGKEEVRTVINTIRNRIPPEYVHVTDDAITTSTTTTTTTNPSGDNTPQG